MAKEQAPNSSQPEAIEPNSSYESELGKDIMSGAEKFSNWVGERVTGAASRVNRVLEKMIKRRVETGEAITDTAERGRVAMAKVGASATEAVYETKSSIAGYVEGKITDVTENWRDRNIARQENKNAKQLDKEASKAEKDLDSKSEIVSQKEQKVEELRRQLELAELDLEQASERRDLSQESLDSILERHENAENRMHAAKERVNARNQRRRRMGIGGWVRRRMVMTGPTEALLNESEELTDEDSSPEAIEAA